MPNHTCPYCAEPLDTTYLYVRGLGAALHTGADPDVSWFSRSGLTQVDLGEISETGTGGQAVVKALSCESCGAISFRTKS